MASRSSAAGPALCFNLSHSGASALYAFAADGPVGVDVEVARRPLDAVALAARRSASRRRAGWRAGADPAAAGVPAQLGAARGAPEVPRSGLGGEPPPAGDRRRRCGSRTWSSAAGAGRPRSPPGGAPRAALLGVVRRPGGAAGQFTEPADVPLERAPVVKCGPHGQCCVMVECVAEAAGVPQVGRRYRRRVPRRQQTLPRVPAARARSAGSSLTYCMRAKGSVSTACPGSIVGCTPHAATMRSSSADSSAMRRSKRVRRAMSLFHHCGEMPISARARALHA